METNQFKNTLKDMAADFTVPVNERLFEGVLKKQQAEKQRKRRFILYVASVGVVLSMVGTWIAINSNDNQGSNKQTAFHKETTAKIEQHKSGTFSKTEKNELKGGSTNAVSEPSKPAPKQTEQALQVNSTSIAAHARQRTVNQQRLNNESLKSKRLLASKQATANYGEPKKLLKTLNAGKMLQLSPADSRIPDSKTLDKQEDKLVDEQVSFTDKPATSNLSKDNAEESQESSASQVATIEPVVQVAQSDSTTATLPQPTRKAAFGIYMQGAYHLITSARNVTSELPKKFTDTLGLKEKANYAYGAEAGFMYQATPQLSFMLGLGYHTVFFDEIRFAITTKLDSVELYSNAVSEKIVNAFPINYATETRLSWLEVPVWVKYRFLPKSKLNYYMQTGFSIQHLLSQRGYAIVENPDGTSTFTSYDNYELNRFNKTQVVWLLSGGIEMPLGKHFSVNAGLNYRRHLSSYYKGNYIKRNPAGFIGVTSGISFVF